MSGVASNIKVLQRNDEGILKSYYLLGFIFPCWRRGFKVNLGEEKEKESNYGKY
jgi:hypothetical protein